ncbi:MAG: hypothetical protein WB756_19915 [Xanthobacteraceae bacterium]
MSVLNGTAVVEDNGGSKPRPMGDFINGIDPKRTSPMLFGEYSLHEPRRGRDDIEAFMTDFRKAAPDSNFWAPRT